MTTRKVEAVADGGEPALVVLVDGDRDVLVCRLVDLGSTDHGWTGEAVAHPARARLSAIDALARLRLAARRGGRSIRLDGGGPELRALLDLLGLL
jgi:hypothetical protein